jgi:beta-N-acetylhexosaminidase
MATTKHFPGHGDTDTDSHLALPVVKSSMARLDSVELPPFRAAIKAGVGGVMTAHIALPALGEPATPATLVPQVVTGLLRDSLGFSGLVFTDALAMQGIGKGYDVGESAVLAVKAGADVLLQPTDVPRTIQAVVSAVESGEITPQRIERSVRAILETKARLGLDHYAQSDLTSLRRVVGAPTHWDTARSIAARAVTLIRDRGHNVPIPANARVFVVTYAPENELVAGRAFAAQILSINPRTSITRITPRTSPAALDSLDRAMAAADRIIITTHVRTIEGAGRFAVPERISQWVNSLAKKQRAIVIANGNPYVIRDFPDVGTYMLTYGIGPLLERASALAVFGAAPISGRSPISLPGYFSRGDGLSLEAAR